MINLIILATLAGATSAKAATYDELLRQQQASAANARFQQEVSSYNSQVNRLNGQIMAHADRFAGKHGGYASAPTATYTNVRENFFDNEAYKEDRAFAYSVDHGPARIHKLDFTTNDGYVCKALIYGVECIHATTGKQLSVGGIFSRKRGR